jgi:hypothetical protein
MKEDKSSKYFLNKFVQKNSKIEFIGKIHPSSNNNNTLKAFSLLSMTADISIAISAVHSLF